MGGGPDRTTECNVVVAINRQHDVDLYRDTEMFYERTRNFRKNRETFP
jgi:hypothetical protein